MEIRMKKVILPLLALLLAGAACQNENRTGVPTAGRRAVTREGECITLRTAEASPLTKTLLGSDGVSVYWTEGDRLGVYSTAGSMNADFTYVRTEGGLASFSGTMRGTPAYAYYPYCETAGNEVSALQLTLPANQVQDDSGLPNMQYDLKTGTCTGGAVATGYNLTFTQKNTPLHFIISNPHSGLAGDKLRSIAFKAADRKLAGAFTLDLTAVVPLPVYGSEASDEVVLTFPHEPLMTPSGAIEGWMFIHPDVRAGDALEITLTTDRSTVRTLSASAREDFEYGTLYEITMDLAALETAGRISTESIAAWFERNDTPGLYSLAMDERGVFTATALHTWESITDQYGYGSVSGSYFYRLQSIRKAKLSQITVPASLTVGSNCNATLHTVHGTDGLITESWEGCQVLRSHGTKYWIQNAEGTRGFIFLKEE